MNWIDTSLLVYEAIIDHPANATVAEILRDGAWASTVLVLLEVYHVLTRDYAASVDDAAAAVDTLAQSPIYWAPVDLDRAMAAVGTRKAHRVQSADAALLSLAKEDDGTIVAHDRRLLRLAESQGIPVRDPITLPLAAAIARWEANRVAPKGLARILDGTERWLRAHDEILADRFLEETGRLTRLPS